MTKESGRATFRRYQHVLRIFCGVVDLMPAGLRSWLWDLSRPFAGKPALVLRYAVLKSEAASIGDAVYIGRNVTIRNATGLVLGNNVSIHENCYIDAIGGCTIGDNVSIAHASSILTFDHLWENTDQPMKYNHIVTSPVQISDDVWVGAGVRILRGTKVGCRSVLAAGSVARSEIPPRAVYGGVPAKKLRDT